MSSSKKLRNRIPAGELSGVKPWSLPSVHREQRSKAPFVRRPEPASAPLPADVEEVEIKPPTLKEIEAIRQAAYQEGLAQGREEGFAQGYQEGITKGHADGLANGTQEMRERSQQLAQLAGQLQAPLEAERRALEAVLLQLALTIARGVVGAELTLAPEHVAASLREALQALPRSDEPLTVLVHPSCVELVETVRAQDGADWQVAAEPQLAPGGVRLRNRISFVDYAVETRYQHVVDQLLARQDSSTSEA